MRLCEFVRNFSALELTAGNDRTVKVELSSEEHMSSNNCESWLCSVTEAASKEVVDGMEEVEDTERPESGDVSLELEVLLGGGGGGRSL